jgi:nucleotide-binding universal stress UspA family protein
MMISTNIGPVVAGVDGSEDARLAVDLAAWEADRRHVPLRLVYGFQPVQVYGMVAVGYDLEVQVRELRDMLSKEAARITKRYPDLTVATEVIRGVPSGVLVDESASASLVVLGSRGLGGFATLLAGSVSAQVAAHAKTPVIVVRPPAGHAAAHLPGTGPVVVGVDGSTGSAAAVEFAFDQAAARGTGLIAVYAWGILPKGAGDDDPFQEQQAAETALAEALAGWQDKYPDVHVQRRAIHSLVPVHTILDESQGASLIVVGPRGRGGFAGLLLGSVGDGLVRHAGAPVAVVHTQSSATS